MKKALLFASAVAVSGLVVWFLLPESPREISQHTNGETVVDRSDVKATQTPSTEEKLIDTTLQANNTDDQAVLFGRLAAEMRAKFGAELAQAIGKLKMIADLRNWFMAQYPEDWLEQLLAFLQSEFPDDAESLVAMLQSLLQYEEFAQGLDLTQFASSEDLNAYMWEQRERLFGEDATELWAEEHKANLMRDNVQALGEVVGNFGELQQQYVDSRISVYGETAFEDQASETNNMMNEFLTLNNVQNELKNMPPAERQSSLREFRESLGMDEQALDRWEALDQKRDIAWEQGEEYMARRTDLTEAYSGSELDEKIQQLQNELFTESHASVLRKEEASGFFRYERERTIGLN